jgi:two-component sensor histidine kinase
VDLKSYSKKWYKFIFGAVTFLLFLNLFVEITHFTTSIKHIYSVFRWVFIVLLLLLSIIGYIPLFKIKGFLKYYIIVGSLSFLFFSILALIISKYGLISEGTRINVSVFYFGAIIENLCFSLGLGHKQKIILQEKNESKEKLINQLQKNEILQLKVQQQLEKDITSFSKKAEKDKFEKLKAEYDKELIELKMTSLRIQMNPHFIFNSLNAIKLYIIDNEKENAVYYLNKFSKLIRKILATTQESEITLDDEIETMELYMNIENIRFNNEIDCIISADQKLNLNTIKVPSLILQPFIENAFWHGLASKKGRKKLDILIEKENKSHIKISIIDNGIGRKKSADINNQKMLKKKSIGIKLTEERLVHFSKGFQNNYSLDFIDLYDNEMPTGTKVILKIPLK